LPVETAEDLAGFFNDEELAVRANVTDGADFDIDINVIFDNSTEGVGIYESTTVEAANPSFEAITAELAGVSRGMIATIANAAYKVERVRQIGDGATSIVELSK
jgi:hypothetical protein